MWISSSSSTLALHRECGWTSIHPALTGRGLISFPGAEPHDRTQACLDPSERPTCHHRALASLGRGLSGGLSRRRREPPEGLLLTHHRPGNPGDLAIRAILLARATAATRRGLRVSKAATHGCARSD